ncbi:prolyl oligopeptidase family serine peptidase [Parasphingorhabdus sp.]|uniref:S9 family peptidase n=1 Tax=Parasphingorhabdus sp. TaxID=2709688 RepID=UPI0032ED3745
MAEESMTDRFNAAAKISRALVDGSIKNTRLEPNWIPGSGSFWYARDVSEGREFRIVDAAAQTNRVAFDHARLAELIQKETGEVFAGVTAYALPLADVKFTPDHESVEFILGPGRWRYDKGQDLLAPIEGVNPPGQKVISPDGSMAAILRDFNLWVVDLTSGEERQLTHDGERLYPYASQPPGSGHLAHIPNPAMRLSLEWSPDSKRIFTHRIDCLNVATADVIEFAPPGGGRSNTFQIPFAYPGDENIPMAHFLSVGIATGDLVYADCDPVPIVRMDDDLFSLGLAWYSAKPDLAYFVATNRGETEASVIEFDTTNGQTRVVFTETSDTYLELGPLVYARSNVYYVASRHAFTWQSERSGMARLYLYDAKTGELLSELTTGNYRVVDVIRVAEDNDEIWFTACCFDDLEDPYRRALCRVKLDGSEFSRFGDLLLDQDVLSQTDFGLMLARMAGADTSGMSGVSPCGEWFAVTTGNLSQPSSSAVYDRNGNKVLDIEVADFSAVMDNWQWPEEFFTTAADGKTLIRGVMVKPSDFDPSNTYPVIDQIYAGPQTSYAPKAALRDFSDKLTLSDAFALAELGAIVVIIDGRGTTLRDRSFHDHSSGALQKASDIDDHVAAIQQLAERYAFIDAGRVGITGLSAGGYGTAHAMLARPDFYKVGVACAGNYDAALFKHGWSERYQGLPGEADYENQRLTSLAPNLKGRLLFIHGLLDHGCHPAALFQLTQALSDANKNYDLFVDPSAGHERSGHAYWRMWNYFSEHLLEKGLADECTVQVGLSMLVPPSRKKREAMLNQQSGAPHLPDA